MIHTDSVVTALTPMVYSFRPLSLGHVSLEPTLLFTDRGQRRPHLAQMKCQQNLAQQVSEACPQKAFRLGSFQSKVPLSLP